MPGQHRLVGVQLGAVGRVRNRPEHGALVRGRVVEHQQRLVGVDGDDGRVEKPRRAVTGLHQHPAWQPAQRVHRHARRDLVEP